MKTVSILSEKCCWTSGDMETPVDLGIFFIFRRRNGKSCFGGHSPHWKHLPVSELFKNLFRIIRHAAFYIEFA